MITLQEIIHELDLTLLTDPEMIKGKTTELGYTSDMLSCVMAGAKHNSIWVTLQAHLNIIAVATLLDLSAIIITEGNQPDSAAIEKANQEDIVLLSTKESTFNIVGRLWQMESAPDLTIHMQQNINRGSFRRYRAELHIHTVLSPCALVEMIPPLIIQEALSKRIDILAITDHNSMLNVPAMMKAAEGTDITVLPGMELHTREEVHVLCIFETLYQASEFQAIVNLNYSPGINDIDIFGPQYVVDHTGDFIRYDEHMLSQATRLSIDEAWKHVHQLDGLFIPSHIQRNLYGILPTLGFLPENIPFDGLEISRSFSFEKAVKENPSIQGYPFIRNGDAHDLQSIAGYNIFTINCPTLSEIRLALQNLGGRSIDTPHEIA